MTESRLERVSKMRKRKEKGEMVGFGSRMTSSKEFWKRGREEKRKGGKVGVETTTYRRGR